MWKGVLIEESMDVSEILSEIKIRDTKVTAQEEEDKGEFHFYNIEVFEDKLEKVIEFISHNIKEGWYFHLVKDREMIVLFHNKVFKAKNEHQNEIDEIRKYARSQGIIAEKLPLEKLFDNPYL